jgi:glycosyltransferase involved in cell wall biosynthesis
MTSRAPGQDATARHYDILFVGRLIRAKGIFVLANALARLWSNGLKPRVAIAGQGPDAATLIASVKGLNVTFLGALGWTELADIYARSRMLVLPSICPEGMGMVLVEGFAFGLPAITSDEAGMSEITEDAGIPFASGNSDSLAAKVSLLLSNEALYHSLSQNAWRRAEKFSYSMYLSQVRDALILATNPRRRGNSVEALQVKNASV